VPRRSNTGRFYIFVYAGILALDQVFQGLYAESAVINKEVLWGGVVGLERVYLIVPLAIFAWWGAGQLRKKWERAGFWMIVTGGGSNAVSNLRFSGVVDYLTLWGVAFNMSDLMITLGVGLVIAEYMLGYYRKWHKN